MLNCNDKDIHVIGQRMSEEAIAGSFDVWRRYMEGRPHPGDTEEGRIVNLERAISATGEGEGRPHPGDTEEGRVVSLERAISTTGEPIGEEEVRYDEAGQGMIELWDEVDRGEPVREEGAPRS
jgi:hypothetical protein